MKLMRLIAIFVLVSGIGCFCKLWGQTNSPPPATAAKLSEKGANLVDLHLQSKDRMFRGQIKVDPSWKHTSFRFVNVTTKQDLGTYTDILENMKGGVATVKIYNHQSDIFSDEDMKEAKTNPLITQQKVVFFKDDTDSTVVCFTSTFDDVGTVQVQVIQNGKMLEYGETKLTRDAAFSTLIQSTDQAITDAGGAPTNQMKPSQPPSGK